MVANDCTLFLKVISENKENKMKNKFTIYRYCFNNSIV